MGDPLSAGMGAGVGGLAGGLMGFATSKKTAGSDASNPFDLGVNWDLVKDQLKNFLNYQGSDAAIDPLKSSQIAAQQVQSNPILAGLFGKGGTLEQTIGQEKDLANRGFSLQPEDHEAYGQASDQLARQFGASEGNLASALAARGLSASPMAAQGFSGMEGNKNEQLARAQLNIANNRMNMNMQRLGQMQNFLSQMGQQGANAIQQQYGRQMGSEQQNFNEQQAKNAAAFQRMAGFAGQANENFAQRMASQTMPTWASTMAGMGSGAIAGMGSANGGSSGSGSGGSTMSGNRRNQYSDNTNSNSGYMIS